MIPQFIYLLLLLVGLCLSANRHGREKKENFWTDVISTVVIQALLYWGGFFDPIINKLIQ